MRLCRQEIGCGDVIWCLEKDGLVWYNKMLLYQIPFTEKREHIPKKGKDRKEKVLIGFAGQPEGSERKPCSGAESALKTHHFMKALRYRAFVRDQKKEVGACT